MTPGSFVKIARPEQTIQQAAMVLAEIDAGLLPVGDNDRMVGKITDRDIAVRAVANGKGPQTLVCDVMTKDVMTKDVKSCFEDEDIKHVTRNLGDEQVRRLPIVNRTSVCSASSHLPMLPPAKAGNKPRRAGSPRHCLTRRHAYRHRPSSPVPLMPTPADADYGPSRANRSPNAIGWASFRNRTRRYRRYGLSSFRSRQPGARSRSRSRVYRLPY